MYSYMCFTNRSHCMLNGLSPKQGEDDSNMAIVTKAKIKYLNTFKKKKPSYSIGTYVRVKKERDTYRKGYKPSFSEAIYKITAVRDHLFIPLYTLATYDGTEELKVRC